MYHVGLMTDDSAAEMAGGLGTMSGPVVMFAVEQSCCMMDGVYVDCLLPPREDLYWGRMLHESVGWELGRYTHCLHLVDRLHSGCMHVRGVHVGR